MKTLENQPFLDAVKTMITHVGEDVTREGLLKTPQRVLKAYEFMFGE
jgi:GTP cyclohydrolase I